MLNMTQENLEKWRASFKATYTNIAHPDLDAICDAALQALSQPKDVKRPEFWSEERLRDFEQNVIDADKLTPQIRALQAYIEQQDAEIADIIEEKDGYKFSAKAFEGAFEECRLNLSALEQPTAQGWRPIGMQPSCDPVLLAVQYTAGGLPQTIRARWIPKHTEEHNGEDDETDYDEQTDCYYTPEGWYETNYYEETNWKVEGTPLVWQPLPQPPRSEVSNG